MYTVKSWKALTPKRQNEILEKLKLPYVSYDGRHVNGNESSESSVEEVVKAVNDAEDRGEK